MKKGETQQEEERWGQVIEVEGNHSFRLDFMGTYEEVLDAMEGVKSEIRKVCAASTDSFRVQLNVGISGTKQVRLTETT